METKDWIGIALTVWSNIIATVTLATALKGKRKTATRNSTKKRKR